MTDACVRALASSPRKFRRHNPDLPCLIPDYAIDAVHSSIPRLLRSAHGQARCRGYRRGSYAPHFPPCRSGLFCFCRDRANPRARHPVADAMPGRRISLDQRMSAVRCPIRAQRSGRRLTRSNEHGKYCIRSIYRAEPGGRKVAAHHEAGEKIDVFRQAARRSARAFPAGRAACARPGNRSTTWR
jgi:hypothetical protein